MIPKKHLIGTFQTVTMVECDGCGARITLMDHGFTKKAHIDAEYGNRCRSCAGSSDE